MLPAASSVTCFRAGSWPDRRCWDFRRARSRSTLLIGILLEASVSETLGWLLIVGFCGGFTTFSTFSADTVRLLRAGCYNAAAIYVALSVAVCIVFAALGMWIGTTFRN